MEMVMAMNKAKIFLKNNIRAFLVVGWDDDGEWVSCEIKSVHEDFMWVQHITGDKKGIKEKIFYIDIVKFKEYQDKRGEGK